MGNITDDDIARAREALSSIFSAVPVYAAGEIADDYDVLKQFLEYLTPGPVEVTNLQGKRREFELEEIWLQDLDRPGIVAIERSRATGLVTGPEYIFESQFHGVWKRSHGPRAPAPLLAALRQWLADQIKVEG